MIRQSSGIISLSILQSQRGVALFYLIIMFTLLGVLVSGGLRMLSSSVTGRMVNDTKTILGQDVQTITVWAARNGRLPAANELPAVFGSVPLDAWGKPLVYIYDGNLTAVVTGGVCGRIATTISHEGKEVAFLLVSGGEDMVVNSTPAVAGTYSGTLGGVTAEDLYQIVTLNELQSRADCAATSQGTLRIVNNELPTACEGISYKATLFSDGGVQPVDFSYPALPVWLTPIGVHFENLSGSAAPAPSSDTINVTVTDAATNSVSRAYLLKIDSCP